jgi:putative hemolysin
VLTDIFIVSLLLLLNGVFAMSEMAVVSARKAWLKGLAEETGHRGAKSALALLDDPSTFLSFVQIGMTLISVFAGAFSGATLSQPFGEALDKLPWLKGHGQSLSFAATVGCVTYFNLVIGELVPKRIALAYAEGIAIRVAPVVRLFVRLIAPIVWFLKISTDAVLSFFKIDEHQQTPVTEDEVKDLIAEGAESGLFKPAEKKMLDSVLRLSDRTVRGIMTPRMDMVWLDVDDPAEENAKIVQASGYSRFPIARGDLDEVLGIVYAKDILNQTMEGQAFDPVKIMKPPLRVPDTAPVTRLLEQFRQSRQHLAVVVDEYGSVEGIVSLRDILEAIAGELPELGQDSDDKPVKRQDGSWLLDGMMSVDEVELLLDLRNMRDGADFHTLAGFVIEHLGHMPSTGECFMWNDVKFEVVDMDARRVDRVLVDPSRRLELLAAEEE